MGDVYKQSGGRPKSEEAYTKKDEDHLLEAIEWLTQPRLQAIACNNNVGGVTRQNWWFEGSLLGTFQEDSLQHLALLCNCRHGVKNALRWLHIKPNPTAYNWRAFLEYPFMQ